MEDERGVLGRGGFTAELMKLQFQSPAPVCVASRGSLNYKSFGSHESASTLVLVQFSVGKVEAICPYSIGLAQLCLRAMR